MKNSPFKNQPLQDDPLTRRIIACAIEVHKRLGPGLLEKLYKEALAIEMELNGLKVDKNVNVPVEYKGRLLGEYFIDRLVEGTVILELTSVERHDPVLYEAHGKESWTTNQFQFENGQGRYQTLRPLVKRKKLKALSELPRHLHPGQVCGCIVWN